MLEYNEVTVRKYIELEGEPYEVLTSHVFRKQMRKPVNQTKLKNLITGKVVEQAFHATERVLEAEIDLKKAKYLYENKGQFWFSEESDPSKRFFLTEEILGVASNFMKPNSMVDLSIFGEKIIGVRMPVKVELKVTEANPAVRGNTVQGGTKQVTLETGAILQVPMFINEGDIIRVNTETGEYVDRADKNVT